MAKPRLRNNTEQFQKYATVIINKNLEKVAEETGVNIRKVVADQLYKTYTENVEKSYSPRATSTEHPYEHTDTFLESIDVVTEGNKVKVVINNKKYKQISERTTEQVYKFLTEGTVGRRILSILG